MTKTLTLSALALLIAAPVFANSQLELSAGVPAGAYTTAQAGEIASAETVADALRLKKFYAAANAGEVSRNDFSAAASAAPSVRNGGSDRN